MCTHKNVEQSQCHYTYVSQFSPTQEEMCEKNFEKVCSSTFKQQVYNEMIEECMTVYESTCTARYVEKQPGKFVVDTKYENLPTELCGAGCPYDEGEEECHDIEEKERRQLLAARRV